MNINQVQDVLRELPTGLCDRILTHIQGALATELESLVSTGQLTGHLRRAFEEADLDYDQALAFARSLIPAENVLSGPTYVQKPKPNPFWAFNQAQNAKKLNK